MGEQENEIGLIGLGEMGRNLALNMADHGFLVAVHNRTESKTKAFMAKEVGEKTIKSGYSLPEFITLLRKPRIVLMMISAGQAVDEMIQELIPLLEANDLIIDGGNSLFSDTDRREKFLAEKGLLYLGLGISGGGWGARYGPSLMPGGSPQAYERVRPILEAIAAKADEIPCVSLLGSGSAGHYVKMVHNGIEYGLMQLIAETYHLLKQGLGLDNDELSLIFNRWNQTELQAYLIEITARIFRQEDEISGGRLIDQILDQAGQEGTGRWTSMSARELKVPVPTIDLAVVMRDLSGDKQERQAVRRMLGGDTLPFQGEQEKLVVQIGEALYGGMILTYIQGLTLLRKGSLTYHYGLDLGEVARIWSGGCIIRAFLLKKIRIAYRVQPDLFHPLIDHELATRTKSCQDSLRMVIKAAVDMKIPLPGLMASLIYYDSFCSPWLPANLIQAQRDYFGAHTYKRTDVPGIFHTEWIPE